MIEITPTSSSVDVRRKMVDTLRLDLIGPHNDHAFARELLPETPTRWYLTGFLVPSGAPIAQRFDETSTEEIDSATDSRGLDDDSETDRAPARPSLLPSSLGLSVLVPTETKHLKVHVEWGEYSYEGPGEELQGEVHQQGVGQSEDSGDADGGANGESASGNRPCWRRSPLDRDTVINLPEPNQQPLTMPVPNSGGLYLLVTVRLADSVGVANAKAVSVFLVNSRTPNTDYGYLSFIFQVRMKLACSEGFVPRPDPRSWTDQDEWDQRVSDLHYRDCFEFGVGHGVSAEAIDADGEVCHVVRTTWIPEAEVNRVEPEPMPDVTLRMEDLASVVDVSALQAMLRPLVDQYRAWITAQRGKVVGLSASRAATANEMLQDASTAADRIETGIDLLTDNDIREAFQITNRAMAAAGRRRAWIQGEKSTPIDQLNPPEWRPFQLAFLLMTLRGIAEPEQAERETVDLLFFPTGGGKTEAYFGLAAFTLIHRRLKNPGIRSAGLTVLMRYTLRLLTLDQLGRASALICALELERQQRTDRLGDWPFEIGLWVGQAATPNRMGARGQRDPECRTAYCKTRRFKQNSNSNPSPIPIEECPWCGTKFAPDSFRLMPNEVRPTDLRVHCIDHNCEFTGDQHLPILGVDEPIYRRLPCFMIATVDKFAALPWTGHTGTLFGRVDRFDNDGFYGPCDPGKGQPLPDGPLLPPDLIIQDELHLISGPLGTISGLYETAIDALAERTQDETRIRPKIVASTATVRRADKQIRALFQRSRVCVFPPPGPDRRNSFFARTHASDESPARLYIGVTAQGRSLKVVLMKSSLAILAAGLKAWRDAGGENTSPNPADPYMTLLGYFNSLRELGGSRRIIEDEVRTRLSEYGRRRRLDPDDRLFVDRHIDFEVLELTSRVSTNDVADAKRRLSLTTGNDDDVDVALATNMISVGLDIIRLGLMVALGQPKSSSEYIQATSRVGRDKNRPGLVVTLLNIHKPRDRSHYERFTAYHNSFYRSVEATSVTPFSPRAMDRALAAAIVALSRQSRAEMTPARGAVRILNIRSELEVIADRFADRAAEHYADMTAAERQTLHDNVRNLCNDLLDDWHRIANQAQQEGSSIQYQSEDQAPSRRLLYEFLHPDVPGLHPRQKRFRANRSMRDVEPSVEVFVKNLNDWEDQQ